MFGRPLTILALLGGLAFASAASAHDANYSVDCSGLNLDLIRYGGSTDNYVTVTIDGSPVETGTLFHDTFKKSYALTPTASHTFKIEIDAQGTSYDKLGAAAITGTWIPCASSSMSALPAGFSTRASTARRPCTSAPKRRVGSRFFCP